MLGGSSPPLPALRVRGVNLAIVTLALGGHRREPGVQERRARRAAWKGRRCPRHDCSAWSFGPNDAASFGDGKLPSPVVRDLVPPAVVVAPGGPRREPSGVRRPDVSCSRSAPTSGPPRPVASTWPAPSSWPSRWRRSSPASAARCRRTGSAPFRRRRSAASRRSASSPSPTSGDLERDRRHARGAAGGQRLGFTALDRWFGVEPGFVNLLGGLGLIITAIVHPEGLAGGLQSVRRSGAALHPPPGGPAGCRWGSPRGRGRGGRPDGAARRPRASRVSFGALRAWTTSASRSGRDGSSA